MPYCDCWKRRFPSLVSLSVLAFSIGSFMSVVLPTASDWQIDEPVRCLRSHKQRDRCQAWPRRSHPCSEVTDVWIFIEHSSVKPLFLWTNVACCRPYTDSDVFHNILARISGISSFPVQPWTTWRWLAVFSFTSPSSYGAWTIAFCCLTTTTSFVRLVLRSKRPLFPFHRS